MPQINIQLVANTSQAVQAITQAFAGIQQQAQSINSIGAQVRGMSDAFFKLSAAAAGLVSVGVFSGFVEQAIASKREISQLDAALRLAGVASAEFSKKLAEQREAFAQSTEFTKSTIADVQRLLVSFGVNEERIGQYTQAILDYAAATSTAPAEAVNAFSKALAGQAGEFKGFKASIDMSLEPMARLDSLVQQLAAHFAGQASAARVADGGYRELNQSISKFKTDLGKAVIDTGVMRGMSELVKAANSTGPSFKQAAADIGLAGVAMVSIPATIAAIGSAARATGSALASMASSNVAARIQAVTSQLTLMRGVIFGLSGAAISATAFEGVALFIDKMGESAAKTALAKRDLEQSRAVFKALNEDFDKGRVTQTEYLEVMDKIGLANLNFQNKKIDADQYHNAIQAATKALRDMRQIGAASTEPKIEIGKYGLAEAEASLKTFAEKNKSVLQTQEAELKSSFDRGLIDEAAYFEKRKEQIQSFYEQEREIISAEMSKVSAEQAQVKKDPTITSSMERAKRLDELAAKMLELEARDAALKQDNTRKLIALNDERFKRQADGEKKLAEATAKRQTDQMDRERRILEFQLQANELEMQLNSGDYTRTSWEKLETEKALLREQIGLYDEKIAKIREAQYTAENDQVFDKMDDEIANLEKGRSGAQNRLLQDEQTPGAHSYVEQLRASVHQLRQEWGTFQQAMASGLVGTLRTAVDQFSSSITNAILVTGNWGKAFLEVGQMIVQTLVQMAVKMAVVAAVSAAIPGMGFGAFMGFAEGGLIQGAPSSTDNRLAAVATGEYVARARAVQYYGPAFFEALNSIRIPREQLMASLNNLTMPAPRMAYRAAYADGGLVVPGGAQPVQNNINVAPAAVNMAVVNTKEELREFLESTPGQKLIIEAVKNNRHSLGIRT